MDTRPTAAANVLLTSSNYGKSRVRLVKVERHAERHDLRELTLHIQFAGDYDDCYVSGDNSRILATDTMKNTVYALAAQGPLGSVETFLRRLAAHFLGRNEPLREVNIEATEHLWTRLDSHAFQQAGAEQRTALLTSDRTQTRLRAGLSNLVVLKTTHSAFEGYIREAFTTLPETSDRIFATAVTARWLYAEETLDYDALWSRVRQLLIDAFAAHRSRSVQHTLHAMAEAVLHAVPAVEEMHLSMPNKHCLPVNLVPLGLENRNEMFLPVDEPHGLIEATLRRAPLKNEA